MAGGDNNNTSDTIEITQGVPLMTVGSTRSMASDAETLTVRRGQTLTSIYSPSEHRGEGRTVMVAIRPRGGYDDEIYVAPEPKSRVRNSQSGTSSPNSASHLQGGGHLSPWHLFSRGQGSGHSSAVPSRQHSSNNSARNSLDEPLTSTFPHSERESDSEDFQNFEPKRGSPNHNLICWAINTFKLDPRVDTLLLVHVRSSIGSTKSKWLDSGVVAAVRLYDAEERVKSIKFLTHYAKYVINTLNYPKCRALTLLGDWKEELILKGEMEKIDALCMVWKEKGAFISKIGARLSIGARGVDQVLYAANFPVCVVKVPRVEQ
ncbi:hypothetical protein H4219_004274 [Mycoemilia scoparia]|uniref:Uncharacterized protein n=1 Tax=Mycoemilia scoparia TaxID=417184 RepID=A0A9W7ZYT5_9FUNG|nr:hypothetical protein H4219_004274 [Mycoemilia scoparia]